MKILTRFLLTHYLRILLLCTAAFVGIYLLIDFFEKVDDFIEHRAALGDYLSYLGYSIPFILVQILPLAILAAMVLTLGGLGRTNEMTAMRACGTSIWHIVKPIMGLIICMSLLLLALNEFVIPWNNQKLNELLEVKLKGKQQTELTRNEIWYRLNNSIINIKVAHPGRQELQGVTIFSFGDDNNIRRRIDAPAVTYQNGQWHAFDAVTREFDTETGDLIETRRLPERLLALGRRPMEFLEREDRNSELNYRQLRAIVHKLESEGYDATRQRVDMHMRLASPFTCLIMGFLGIPFALQRGRNSNIALGIGISLGIGVFYFIIQSLVTAFGYANALPPIVAAWAANVIFLLFGVWLLLNIRE